MLFMSGIIVLLFFGGWLPPLNAFSSDFGFWIPLSDTNVYTDGFSVIVYDTFGLDQSFWVIEPTILGNVEAGFWIAPPNWFSYESNWWLIIKILCFCYLYILVRSGLPRYRYDQLMDLGWKIFLPIALGYLLFVVAILFVFDGLPQVFEIFPAVYTEYDSMINLHNIARDFERLPVCIPEDIESILCESGDDKLNEVYKWYTEFAKKDDNI